MLKKILSQKLLTPAALAIVIIAFGSIVLAHISLDQNVKRATPAVESLQTSAPDSQNAAVSSTQDQSEPCSKTVSKSASGGGPDSSNSSKTDIHCQSQSQNGSNSVDINSDSSQSASSGDSTGQSGNASNSDTTNIDIDISP